MKRYLTGIKPTGIPHIGNYLGAIKPAIEAANSGKFQSFYFIADYHALTTVKSAKELADYTREIACTWLACGLDPKGTVFYRQSDVPETFELTTILNNVAPKGLLDRAHAYKAAKDAGADVNMGLFCYPVLMAADILLFDTNFVPVGQDQKQHVEITQDIAKAFNAVYGKTLVVPEPQISEAVAVVPGLDGRKMSKSYNNVIPLFASEKELEKCIKQIVTDSSAPTDPKPTDHSIFQLYKHFASAEKIAAFEKRFASGIGWGDAKMELFKQINAVLAPMREKYNQLKNNYAEVEKILAEGAAKAKAVAHETLNRVRLAIGVQGK